MSAFARKGDFTSIPTHAIRETRTSNLIGSMSPSFAVSSFTSLWGIPEYHKSHKADERHQPGEERHLGI